MLNDTSTTLSLLHSRRSGKPRAMVEPGPEPDQLDAIMRAAIRVPDHGKLFPWRFIIVEKERRNAFADVLRTAYLVEKPDAGRLELEALDQFAYQAPTLIVALSSPEITSKIPVWEQQLSAGAACMNLLNAAHSLGFVGGWLTGWAAYSDGVLAAFGQPHERIAGFLFIGTADGPLAERPRPDPAAVITRWSA